MGPALYNRYWKSWESSRRLVLCVYNMDQFIMYGAHMDVVLPSHFRYEQRIVNLFEIQKVS
jgi:hypothetical protein